MVATAKIFTTGNSQAVRLPKAFRVDVSEMWITRNEGTGEITLKPKPAPDAMAAFLAELHSMPTTDEFLVPRDDAPRPSPFEGWSE